MPASGGGRVAAPFTVMTFNLLFFNHGFTRAVSSIADSGADVVVLQELSDPAARAIGGRLKERYPHQALRPDHRARGGGILSRFPIAAEEALHLAPHGNICQYAVLDLPGRPLHLYNVHLIVPRLSLLPPRYDHHQREIEATALVRRLTGHPGPLVVAGDFNMTERSGTYTRLIRLLRDSFREAGKGPGLTFPNAPQLGPLRIPVWPAPFPIVRIDYIFHSPDLAARGAWVGKGGGSDHRPVIASLEFRGPV